MKVFQTRIYEGSIAGDYSSTIDLCIDSVARWCAEMGYEHVVQTQPLHWWMSPLARPESVPYLESLAYLEGDCLRLDDDMYIWGTPELEDVKVGFPKWRNREFIAWGEVWSPSLFAMQLKEPFSSSLRDFIWSNHAILKDRLLRETMSRLTLPQRGSPYSVCAWWLQNAKKEAVELPDWYGHEISKDNLHPHSIIHLRGYQKDVQLRYVKYMQHLWDSGRHNLFREMNAWSKIDPNKNSPT